MRTSTAYNHSIRLQCIVSEILAHTRRSALTHEAMLTLVRARVWDDPAIDKMPGWARAEVRRAFLDGAKRLYSVDVYPAELDRREADIAAGRPVPPLPYLRWFLTYQDADGRDVHVTEWSALPEYVKAAARGRGELHTGAHRWNHRRDVIY